MAPALLRKAIPADRSSFEVKVQTHRRIIRTRECRHETQEFDNGGSGDCRIERDHARLRTSAPSI
jgi:hypothetical protein